MYYPSSRYVEMGSCPVHPNRCPKNQRRIFLPWAFDKWLKDPQCSMAEYELEDWERKTECVSVRKQMRRLFVERDVRPVIRPVASCEVTGSCVRPDRWLRRDDEVFLIQDFRVKEEQLARFYPEFSYRSNGHCLMCVFCGSTRGEGRRAREEAMELAWTLEEEYDLPQSVDWRDLFRDHLRAQMARRYSSDSVHSGSFPSIDVDALMAEMEVTGDEALDVVLPDAVRIAECMICYDQTVVVVSDCDHKMCAPCAAMCVKIGAKCPMCRAELSYNLNLSAELVSWSFGDLGLLPKHAAQIGDSGSRRRFVGAKVLWSSERSQVNPALIVVPTQSAPCSDVRDDVSDVESDEDDVEIITKRPRGERGGRRLRRKKIKELPLSCYTGLFTERSRLRVYEELGPQPTIEQIWSVRAPVTGLPKALVLGNYGYHVIPRPSWPTGEQLRYLLHETPKSRVGGEDDDFAEAWFSECADVLLEDPAVRAWLDQPDTPEVEETEEEEVARKVGGSGACWIAMMNALRVVPKKNDWSLMWKDYGVTVEDLLRCYDKWGLKTSSIPVTYWLKWEMQEDGDVHVVNSAYDFYPDAAKRAERSAAGYEPYPEAMDKWRSLLTKFVGKPKNGPLDDALVSITSPDVQRTTQNLRAAGITAGHLEVESICPFAIPVDNQDLAYELAIPFSKTSARTHPHPIHCAVRRWLLKTVMPKYIRTKTTVISIGGENLGMLNEAVNGAGGRDSAEDPLYELVPCNPILDLKDVGRYAGSPDSIPTSVFELPTNIDTPTVFMFDSGHYVREGGLLRFFAENPAVDFVLMSHVYPLDALVTNTSTRPTLYQWTVTDKTMVYIPEGDVGGRYEQPADPGLLLLKKIESHDGKLSIHGGIVESKMNTHLQLWSRYNLSTYQYLPLLLPTMMPIPRVFRSQQETKGLVRTDDYLKMVQYAKTLKNPREEDFWAKLRLFVEDRAPWLTLSDRSHLVKVVGVVARLQLAPDLQEKFYNSATEEVWYKTVGHLIRIKDKLFAHRYARRAAGLVNNPDPVRTFPLGTATVKWQNEDACYSLQWAFPVCSKENILGTIKYWARYLVGLERGAEKEVFTLDDQGLVRWGSPISRTVRNVRAHGVDLVFASQAHGFWRTFDPGRLSKRSKHEVEGHLQMTELDEEELALSKKKEKDFARDEDVISVDTLPLYGSESGEKPPVYMSWLGSGIEGGDFQEYQKVLRFSRKNPFRATALKTYHDFSETESESEESHEWKAGALAHRRTEKLSERLRYEADRVSLQGLLCHVCLKETEDVKSLTGVFTYCGECGVLKSAVKEWRESSGDGSASSVMSRVMSNVGDDCCDECPKWEDWRVSHVDDYLAYQSYCDQMHAVRDHELLTSEGKQHYANILDKDYGQLAELPTVPPPDAEKDEPARLFSPMLTREKYRPKLSPTPLKAISDPKLTLPIKAGEETLDEKRERWAKVVRGFPRGSAVARSMRGKELWDVQFKNSVDKRVRDVPYSKCTVFPHLTYPAEDCVLAALEEMVGEDRLKILAAMCRLYPSNGVQMSSVPLAALHAYGCYKQLHIVVIDGRGQVEGLYGLRKTDSTTVIKLRHEDGHVSPTQYRPSLTIRKAPFVSMDGMPPGYRKMMSEVSRIPAVNWKSWIPEGTRASLFCRAMLEKTTGTLWQNPLNDGMLKSWEDASDSLGKLPSERRIAVIEGDPGCRKSSSLQKILANKAYQRHNLFSMVAATNVLGGDWKSKLGVRTKDPQTGKGAPPSTVVTYEKALTDNMWGFLMITDEEKYPKGYHALYALRYPHVRDFIILGDRYQSKRHEPNSDCLLNDPDIATNTEFYSQYTDIYLRGTWRFGPSRANFFQLPTFVNDTDLDGFFFSDTLLTNWMALKPYLPGKSDEIVKELWNTRHVYTAANHRAISVGATLQWDVQTFSGSQGLTADVAVVVVDEQSVAFTDPSIWYTVLTRSKMVIMCNVTGMNTYMIKAVEANPVLRELYWYKGRSAPWQKAKIHPAHTVSMQELLGKLTCKQVLHGRPENVKNIDFVEPFLEFDWKNQWIDPDDPIPKAGLPRLRREGWLAEEAQFGVNIEEWQHYRPQEDPHQAYLPQEQKILTHLPPVVLEHVDERHDAQVLERFAAELSWKNLWSSQKPDAYMWRTDQYEVAARLKRAMFPKLSRRKAQQLWEKHLSKLDDHENPLKFKPNFLNWGQYQSSFDAPSFAAGVAQRMRFASREENVQDYARTADYGNALWTALCKYLQWDPDAVFPMNQAEMEDSIIEFQERRASRSEALQKASMPRADPDFVTVLTAKTQWKMKDVDFPVAKPLQTILIKSDTYLFEFGPIGVYLLKKLLEHSPGYMYWHAKKTLADMAKWTAEYDAVDDHEMLDVSGYDRSVRGEGVVLMERLMMRFGVPQESIDRYREDKLDFHTRTLAIAIMTMSGEAFTWLGNSIKIAARECLKYNLSPGHPMKVSGDDVKRRSGVPENPEYEHLWGELDTCVEKRFSNQPVGEFCSVKSKRGVIYKDPIILYKRLRGQLSRGKLDDVALGYFDLFSLNYQLGDVAYEVMDEVEIEHASAVNHIMFNIRRFGYKKKLPWEKLDATAFDTPSLDSKQVNSVLSELGSLLEKGIENLTLSYVEPDTGAVVDFEF